MVRSMPLLFTALVLTCSQTTLLAEQGRHDLGGSVEAKLHPRLAWIRTQKIRAGYNYCASLDYYPIAKECGMNAIISRLEIANDPAGDVALSASLKPGRRKPTALVCYELVQPSSRLAKQLGLHWFYMLNPAGSHGPSRRSPGSNYKGGIRDNPRRYNNGDLWAPTDDIYWTRVVENRFLRVAELLRGDEYQIDGFLIDPEMYAFGGRAPGGVDFGDYALGEFLKENGRRLDLTGLSIAERKKWIEARGLTEALRAHQFERIKSLTQRTRERIQAIHPGTLFGFFLWKDSLWFKAAAAGFATPQTPCFVGPEGTYPGSFDKEEFLGYRDSVRRAAEVPILFTPGLWLTSTHAPERLRALRGNLYRRAIHTQGYWCWSLGQAFGQAEARPPVVDLLRSVNAELDRYLASGGTFESALRPAPLPVPVPDQLEHILRSARSWTPVSKAALPTSAPAPSAWQLRRLHTFVFLAREKTKVELAVRNVKLGSNLSGTAIRCFRPDGTEVLIDNIPLRESRQLTVEANMPGPWVLAVTSHRNVFRVHPSDSGVLLYSPEDSIHGCRGRDEVFRYFFYVPQATEKFRLSMWAKLSEPATFRLFGPEGQRILEEKRLKKPLEREVDATALQGRVCWIETVDTAEDHAFRLIGIPNIYAMRPEQLLAPKQ